MREREIEETQALLSELRDKPIPEAKVPEIPGYNTEGARHIRSDREREAARRRRKVARASRKRNRR